MVNMVYCLEDSSILICQNPDSRSRHEKWPAPTKLSKASWVLGSGYEFIWALRHKNLYKSVVCHLSSWLTPLHYTMHSDWGKFHLNPTFLTNASEPPLWGWRYLPKSFLEWGIIGNFNDMFSWMDAASLLGSNEKTSWYSAKRDQVEATSSGGHDSNLLRSNSWNNFSCLCFTVNLGIWWLLSSTSPIIPGEPICARGSGTWVTSTALTTGVFFLRVWG